MNPSTLLRPIAAFAVLVGLCALPGAASAASGGSQMKVLPKIAKVICVKDCAGKKGARKVRGGSTIRLTGKDLDAAAKIVFLGSRGKSDDAVATPLSAKTRALTVRVPADSSTGPIAALTDTGDRSKATAIVPILPQPPVIGTPDLRPVSSNLPGVQLETGTSTPRTVFLGAKQLVRFSLRASGPGDKSATVTLTRQSTGEAVASWSLPAPDGQIVSVDWDGRVAGQTAATGRYSFSASLSAADLAVQAANAPAAAGDPNANAFDVYGFVFPVRGKHNYGGRGAGFGGGRGHQGQDIMAKCGVKLVAARGGIVVESRFQSAAGNFIVIRPDAPGVGDQAYMHMPVKSPFNKGDRVYTGQTIGSVGRTGRASACHLHFEQWTGKIWSSRPVDPLVDLKAWDLVS